MIDKAFEEETHWAPSKISISDYVAERVFKVLGLKDEDRGIVWARFQAHATRSWEGLTSEMGPFLKSVEMKKATSELMDILRLKIEYDKATHSMCGSTAYRFSKWLQREGIEPTPGKYTGISSGGSQGMEQSRRRSRDW